MQRLGNAEKRVSTVAREAVEILMGGNDMKPQLKTESNIVFDDNIKSYTIVLQNALAWSREEIYTLRVTMSDAAAPTVQVKNKEQKQVKSQITPAVSLDTVPPTTSGTWDLSFKVEVPPLGLTTYFISVGNIK